MSFEFYPRSSLIALGLLAASNIAWAQAQHNYATWTSATSFTLNAANAAVTTANTVDVTNNLISDLLIVDGTLNYPDVWFTPAPPVGHQWSLGGVDNVIPGSIGTVDIIVNFDVPVNNPRFHFLNLDNATISFITSTPSLLSGNPLFDVSGNSVNLIPQPATVGGCADAAGIGSNGACGTVELSGSFTNISFTVTDNDTVVGAGDGFTWTVSADAGLILPPPASVPTLSGGGIALLSFLMIGMGGLLLRRQAAI